MIGNCGDKGVVNGMGVIDGKKVVVDKGVADDKGLIGVLVSFEGGEQR